MFGHFKKSASILTDEDTQIVGNDRWPATICNAAYALTCIIRTATCTGIYINMSPETMALTLLVVVIFSMVPSQLASELSVIPKCDIFYKKKKQY